MSCVDDQIRSNHSESNCTSIFPYRTRVKTSLRFTTELIDGHCVCCYCGTVPMKYGLKKDVFRRWEVSPFSGMEEARHLGLADGLGQVLSKVDLVSKGDRIVHLTLTTPDQEWGLRLAKKRPSTVVSSHQQIVSLLRNFTHVQHVSPEKPCVRRGPYSGGERLPCPGCFPEPPGMQQLQLPM